jgi:hypothetical protein
VLLTFNSDQGSGAVGWVSVAEIIALARPRNCSGRNRQRCGEILEVVARG